MEEEELSLDEAEEDAGYVLTVDGPEGVVFMAKDNEKRCLETCHFDFEGSYEDIIANAQDLIDFLKKYGPKHHFEVSEP